MPNLKVVSGSHPKHPVAEAKTYIEKDSALPDIVCFSHLRWNFVFQRPQQLLSRAAKHQHVFFIEEPVFEGAQPESLLIENSIEGVVVVTPRFPERYPRSELEKRIEHLVADFIEAEVSSDFIVWYYTPMALPFSRKLEASAVVYDCMDELSGFAGAPPELKELENELFRTADIVFTGGFSLYHAKKHLHANIHPIPSSIDKEHFMTARKELPDPEDHPNLRPRFGFFGVIDERMDLDLLREVAQLRPQWQFVLVGPVVKIDPSALPKLPNVHYLGGKHYSELPSYLGNWDVAIMPFALNDSTKFISPTKTPEFLAGGIPVVSTPIHDVVKPYEEEGLVHIALGASEFVQACEKALEQKSDELWLKRVDKFLGELSWARTWKTMHEHLLAVWRKSHHLSA